MKHISSLALLKVGNMESGFATRLATRKVDPAEWSWPLCHAPHQRRAHALLRRARRLPRSNDVHL